MKVLIAMLRVLYPLQRAVVGMSIIAASLIPATGRAQEVPLQYADRISQVSLHDHATRLLDTGGRGEPMVLLHALATDHRMWGAVIPLLAPHYRVIAYDIRGHGAAVGAPGPFSMRRFADDLAELLDALKIDHAHIVGLSMGGVIAQEFALSHPDRVRSLSLVATASKRQDAFPARARSGRLDGMQAQIVPTLTRWFTPAMLALNGPGVQYARTTVSTWNPRDWEASWMAMAGMDQYDRIGTIRVPTHVIAGELDVSCPPELMQRDIAERIPGSRFTVIPGASHMVSLSMPEALAEALLPKVQRGAVKKAFSISAGWQK